MLNGEREINKIMLFVYVVKMNVITFPTVSKCSVNNIINILICKSVNN